MTTQGEMTSGNANNIVCIYLILPWGWDGEGRYNLINCYQVNCPIQGEKHSPCRKLLQKNDFTLVPVRLVALIRMLFSLSTSNYAVVIF